MKKARRQDDDLREVVLKRDDYTCRMCNKKKKKLQIHHIQRWADATSLRFEVDNCISLCSACHYSIRNKEVYYISYFYSILRKK